MNIISLTGYELDDFSGSVFGDLLVLGKLPKTGQIIHYICKCHVCSNDPELFGDGYFYTTKAHLKSGRMPCGCSKSPRWNEDQALLNLRRVVESEGFRYLGLRGEFKGSATQYILECPHHGPMKPKSYRDLMSGRRCRECAWEKTAKILTKPDEEHVKEFFFSGNFHPDTIFWRSDRESPIEYRYRKPKKSHWYYLCGECGERSEHLTNELKSGAKGCSCGTKSQKIAYIHLIQDGGLDVALKFGITKRPLKRLKQQQQKTFMNITPLGEWHFESSEDCKSAERHLKNSLDTLVLSKSDFYDGYTETVSITDMDFIIKTFEDFGGVRN